MGEESWGELTFLWVLGPFPYRACLFSERKDVSTKAGVSSQCFWCLSLDMMLGIWETLRPLGTPSGPASQPGSALRGLSEITGGLRAMQLGALTHGDWCAGTVILKGCTEALAIIRLCT